MGQRLGYIRVSTTDQNADLQRDAVEAAGVEKVFTDAGVSGALAERPQLTELLEYAREGDTVVVWRLDRLGRSLKNLLELVETFEQRGIGFHSVTEALETASPAGKMIFQVMGAMAEYERSLIQERTKAGLLAARARGRTGGRKSALSPEQKIIARQLYAARELSMRQIADSLGCSPRTIYRALEETSGTLG